MLEVLKTIVAVDFTHTSVQPADEVAEGCGITWTWLHRCGVVLLEPAARPYHRSCLDLKYDCFQVCWQHYHQKGDYTLD